MEIKKLCDEVFDHVVELRRSIHEEPEIGMDVEKTAAKVKVELDHLGISYRETEHHGIIADIKGEKGESDKMVMIRADMDALPVEEKTGLPYCSKIEGKMHACGHDLHTSMLVGSAIVLNQLKSEFSGTVRLLFQPAEEIAIGAKELIKEGAMDGVSMGFGIHMEPLKPVGTISIANGADWASCDRFEIKVKGESAHGATPQKGKDAIVCASDIVMSLQTIVSREVNPMYPLVITVGCMHGGSAFNVVCDEVTLLGTCRSFDKDAYELIPEAIERVANNIAKAHRCEVEVNIERLSKPLVNNPDAYKMMHASAVKVFGEEGVLEAQKEMIAEDFAEYGELAPCCFAHLGADGEYPLHNGHINFKEESMKYGMALEVQTALDYLNQ